MKDLLDARYHLAKARAAEDRCARDAHLAKVDEHLSHVIAERELPWEEAEVLAIFRRWNAKPDQEVPVESLQLWWGFRENYDSLWAGLGALEAKGLVSASVTGTAYSLTAEGFASLAR